MASRQTSDRASFGDRTAWWESGQPSLWKICTASGPSVRSSVRPGGGSPDGRTDLAWGSRWADNPVITRVLAVFHRLWNRLWTG